MDLLPIWDITKHILADLSLQQEINAIEPMLHNYLRLILTLIFVLLLIGAALIE